MVLINRLKISLSFLASTGFMLIVFLFLSLSEFVLAQNFAPVSRQASSVNTTNNELTQHLTQLNNFLTGQFANVLSLRSFPLGQAIHDLAITGKKAKESDFDITALYTHTCYELNEQAPTADIITGFTFFEQSTTGQLIEHYFTEKLSSIPSALPQGGSTSTYLTNYSSWTRSQAENFLQIRFAKEFGRNLDPLTADHLIFTPKNTYHFLSNKALSMGRFYLKVNGSSELYIFEDINLKTSASLGSSDRSFCILNKNL